MKLRVPAGLIAIALVGCARDRVEITPGTAATRTRSSPPVDMAPLDPIRASINQGKVPPDPNMIRAGLEVGDRPQPSDPTPSVAGSKPARPSLNMVGEGTPGGEGLGLAAQDSRPRSILNLGSNKAQTPLPDASPATGEAAVVAGPSRPPSNMGPEAPGTALGNISASEPAGPELPPATIEKVVATQPASPAPADVRPSEGDRLALPTEKSLDPGKPVASVVAKVGDTLITWRELNYLTKDRIAQQGINPAEIPPDQYSNIMKNVLEDMIDNTMIIQEFRRERKKPEVWKQFSEAFDKEWKEKELPKLYRKFHVENELALRKMFESHGESLDDMKESFLLENMGRDLMMMQVRTRVSKPVMIDMQKYYAKHLAEFDRPAGIKWREIFLPVEPPVSPEAVRKKADGLRERIAKGEKFEVVAKAESAGATAKKGGDWGWSQPGAYGVSQVNAELAKLPIGQVSQAIETPKGVYLVKVEGRRTAGPAPFVEVQKDLANKVYAESLHKEQDAFLKRLREKVVISKYNEEKGRLEVIPTPGEVDGLASAASAP